MVFMQSWKNVVLGATRWNFWAMSFPRKASSCTQLRSKLWSVRDVQCFLGFANFYQKFIHDYSKLYLPLTQLTRKGQSFVWSEEPDRAFESLKKAFTSAPILAHVDPEKPFIIEADASDFALGSICHNGVMMRSYILWLFTHASSTLPKSTTKFMIRSYWQ